MRRVLLVAMIVFDLAILVFIVERVHAQTLHAESAYVLDHPIDPKLQILATAEGRFPIARMTPECGWLVGDMNVHVDQVESRRGFLTALVAHISSGDQTCWVAVGDQVDPTPCFANAAGDCDVNAGEHYWGD